MIIVRYGEIGLKGKLRSWFDNLLVKNMLKVLKEENKSARITREWGRLYVHPKEPGLEEYIAKRLTGVFGVTSTSVVVETEPEIEKIIERVEAFLPTIKAEKSFAIRARRAGKHSFSSLDIQKRVGAFVQENTGARVDLDNPDEIIYIEVRQKKAFIYSCVFSGYGGLPVGSQDRVLSIISDEKSILSSWYALRRGCDLDLMASKRDFEMLRKIIAPWASYREIGAVNWENGNKFKNVNKKRLNTKELGKMFNEAFRLNYKAVYCSLTIDEIEGLLPTLHKRTMPVFTPLITQTKSEIDYMVKIIKNRLKNTKNE